MQKKNRQPDLWSIDRWGRLLAGISVLICTALSLLHHSGWLFATLFCGASLMVSSLTNRCPIHGMLLRLGAREREDLFLPGGEIRPDVKMEKEHGEQEREKHILA